MGYIVTLLDQSTELVTDANVFSHDKALTTFYRTANARSTIDCWSTPLASIRTSEILMIRALSDESPEIGVRHLTSV